MGKINLVEFEEASKARNGRPHSKIAINPDHIVAIRAATATETRINLINQEPVTVACPYQEMIDRLAGYLAFAA